MTDVEGGASSGVEGRWLLPASLAYLAIVFGVMLVRGIEIEPEWVVLALLVIALALGRGKQFIWDWTPFLLLFFAYEVMRGFASKLTTAPHSVAGLDRFLTGGSLPTVDLQRALYHQSAIAPWDWVAIGFYSLHFALPLVVGFYFWQHSRDHYWRFVSALLLMCLLAFVTYLLWPSSPPWYDFPHQVHKVMNETVVKWGVDYYQSPIYSALGRLDPNQFAAFPSLHAAFPALATIYAWRRYRRLGLLLALYTACVWLSIVYLGEHYLVDAPAGFIYAGVATALVEIISRRRSRLSRTSSDRHADPVLSPPGIGRSG